MKYNDPQCVNLKKAFAINVIFRANLCIIFGAVNSTGSIVNEFNKFIHGISKNILASFLRTTHSLLDLPDPYKD